MKSRGWSETLLPPAERAQQQIATTKELIPMKLSLITQSLLACCLVNATQIAVGAANRTDLLTKETLRKAEGVLQSGSNQVAQVTARQRNRATTAQPRPRKSGPASPAQSEGAHETRPVADFPAQLIDRAALSKASYARLALSGQPAPKLSAAQSAAPSYADVGYSALINNNGVVVFSGRVTPVAPAQGPEWGLFWGIPGDIRLFGSKFQSPPGSPNSGFTEIGVAKLRLDDENNVAVAGVPYGSKIPNVWQSKTCTSVFTGAATEGRYGGQFTMANQGRLCGVGSLPRGLSDEPGGEAIVWSWQPGRLDIISYKGQPCPGLAPGICFDNNNIGRCPQINSRGHVFFQTRISGPGVADEAALWLYRDGKLALVARQNESAPGLGEKFQEFASSEGAINASGQVVFMAKTARAWGVWAGEPGNLKLVAADGTASPTPESSPEPMTLRATSSAHILDDGRVVLFESNHRIWTGLPGALRSVMHRKGLLQR